MVASKLIRYRCVTETHQRAAEATVTDTLTIHDGEWAFCPCDIRAKGHTWVEAPGGVAIELLRRGTPRVDISLDARPRPAPDTSATDPAPKRTAKRTRPK